MGTSSVTSRAIIEGFLSEADITVNGRQAWDLQVHEQAFFDRVLSEGALGLGESYMEGWWDVDDLFAFFVRLLSCPAVQDRKNVGWRTALVLLKAKLLNLQTRQQARAMADHHYNLSNELFEQMLGSSLAYSCGYWDNAESLDAAQSSKYDLVCRKLDLQRGERLLDIGCGWGGFAKHAAENYGVEVVGISVANEQIRYARDLCRNLPVEFVECDYRELDQAGYSGSFDKVASIGMIEHVGASNYRIMCKNVFAALRPHGLFLLHSIGSATSERAGDTWLTTYIFPGAVAPSMRQLSEATEVFFVLHDVQNIGVNYAPTLRAWYENFDAYWKSLTPEKPKPKVWGSEETFYRMWRYYLLSCAANFSVGGSQVWQLVYAKGHLSSGYRRPT